MPKGVPSPKVIFAKQEKGLVLISVAAEHCGVHRSAIHKWVKNRLVRYSRHGKGPRKILFVSLDDCIKIGKGR